MGSEEQLLFLSDQDLEALNIQPSEVADAIEAALIAKADGRLHTSPKTAILPGDYRASLNAGEQIHARHGRARKEIT